MHRATSCRSATRRAGCDGWRGAVILDLLQAWLTPQGIVALGMIYAAIEARRSRRSSHANAAILINVEKRVDSVVEKIEEVHLATNSIVTAALAAKDETGVALAAAGVAEGREQMRVEQEKK